MKLVRFKDAGRWAETDPTLPQFNVKKNEEVMVTDSLAETIIRSGKGEIVGAKEEGVQNEQLDAPTRNKHRRNKRDNKQ